ncbi:MAG: hypothetical protein IPG45_15300 [Deltaproteobacteria bacterium]|nr:hypothetical protein [Deltaproteobacteria bacterium]
MNEDVEVLFVASHTHRRGVRFTVAPFDGTTVGEIFYENTDWHSPKIVQYEQPMKLKAGQGRRISLHVAQQRSHRRPIRPERRG